MNQEQQSMDRLAKQHPQSTPVIRELNQHEVQQVSGGLVGEGNLSDFHPIAWPVINVALDAKLKAIKTRF
jgi:hypothetical protein